MSKASQVRFAVIGLDHYHIHEMTKALTDAGATLAAVYAPDDALATPFLARHPQAKRAADVRAVLEDKSIACVVSASIYSDRAPLGIEVMRHGKDFLVDKPG